MKSSGIIVEYNPFHNGHKYHVQKTKETCKPDCLIAVMSGNFLQRGEPALLSKWSRTKMALLNGVDLVIELPYYYATQSANNFAYGGVTILEKLGASDLVFGSEDGDINKFINSANINDITFKNNLTGYSYARSVTESITKNTDLDLHQPNNILGIQYTANILNNKYKIKPLTIKREKANYHDTKFTDVHFASATSIRNQLLNYGFSEEISNYIPRNIYDFLSDNKETYISWNNYYELLKYKVHSSSINDLSSIFLVEEGIENRIKKYISLTHNFEELMLKLKTKRYTWTRIQRTLLNILLNHKKDEVNNRNISYARVLGFTKNGQEYLNYNKKNFDLNIITTPKGIDDSMLSLDIRASRIYSLGLPTIAGDNQFKREFQAPIIL